jgi:hypothetical protein
MDFKKVGIAAGLLLVSGVAFGKAKQVVDLEKNILVDFGGFDAKNIKISGLSLIVPFKMNIKNYSTFSISPTKIWASIEKKDPVTGQYVPFLVTNQIPVLDLKEGTSTTAAFSIEIGLISALKFLDKQGVYNIVTKYNFSGIPQESITNLQAASVWAAISKYFPAKSLAGVSNNDSNFQFA